MHFQIEPRQHFPLCDGTFFYLRVSAQKKLGMKKLYKKSAILAAEYGKNGKMNTNTLY
jgi:hypothetical protein